MELQKKDKEEKHPGMLIKRALRRKVSIISRLNAIQIKSQIKIFYGQQTKDLATRGKKPLI